MEKYGTSHASTIPVWLEDVSRAAQYLARLSLESAAQGALILRAGQLWAYAGQLSRLSIEELARATAGYWARDGAGDLARFVHLESEQRDFLLYATSLVGNMLLALVFDVETPFTKIRTQAVKLARMLSSPPQADEQTSGNILAGQSTSPRDANQSIDATPSVKPLLFDDFPPPSPAGMPGDIVTPITPGEQPSSAEWQPETWDGRKSTPASPAEPNTLKRAPLLPADLADTNLADNNLADTNLADTNLADTNLADNNLADTQPIALNRAAVGSEVPTNEMFPDFLSMSELYLAGVLIPRLPAHHLTGDLVDKLSGWMEQLCLAFGWKLEHLTIRPEALQWVVRISPSVQPKSMLRLIRLHTSQRIFEEYPRFKSENPSGDFWAPGYLITNSRLPLVELVVQSFIQQMRRYQGVSKSAGN